MVVLVVTRPTERADTQSPGMLPQDAAPIGQSASALGLRRGLSTDTSVVSSRGATDHARALRLSMPGAPERARAPVHQAPAEGASSMSIAASAHATASG